MVRLVNFVANILAPLVILTNQALVRAALQAIIMMMYQKAACLILIVKMIVMFVLLDIV